MLANIPFNLEPKEVLKRMHIRGENKHVKEIVEELLEVARPIARPKAVYEVSYVENRNQDSLDIGGIRFTSRLLRVNLDKIERVFPYVATCGREIDEIAIPTKDFMKSYCLDVIKETAVRSTIGYLENYLKRNYALGRASRMNPGAEFWPLTQQKDLFSIFGNVNDLIGVSLTESCMMIPVKSSSGIFFTSEKRFDSCQLCPIKACSERRAPYDSNLVKSYQDDTK